MKMKIAAFGAAGWWGPLLILMTGRQTDAVRLSQEEGPDTSIVMIDSSKNYLSGSGGGM